MRWRMLFVGLLALAGCRIEDERGSDDVEPSGPCPVGELTRADGGCCPAGSFDGGGLCVNAGIPADGCGDGFTARDQSCDPVLPETPCGPGEMALPGETDCRPVADCGTGPWGMIDVASAALFVDASASGSGAKGSMSARSPLSTRP